MRCAPPPTLEYRRANSSLVISGVRHHAPPSIDRFFRRTRLPSCSPYGAVQHTEVRVLIWRHGRRFTGSVDAVVETEDIPIVRTPIQRSEAGLSVAS